MEETSIKLFEQKQVRTLWNDEIEKCYFSIVDVIGVLPESIDPYAFWRKLKQKLKEEGNEIVKNCSVLKMLALDGKMRLADVVDTELNAKELKQIDNNSQFKNNNND